MLTLDYLQKLWGFERWPRRSPIEIRNFGRDQLAEVFHALDFKRGVEIGVMSGLYSEVLCRDNPQAEVYSVDPWLSRPDYLDLHNPQPVFDQWERAARKRLSAYPNNKILKMFSTEASKFFDDRSLDFVYIDGHHAFLPVAQDLVHWTPKIRHGGILAGHDWVRFKPYVGCKVVEVTMAWTAAQGIHPWFILGTKAMLPGEIRDKQRSWCWVIDESHPPARPIGRGT